MQALLNAEQQALVTLARRLAARCAERAARHDRDASFPFDDFADLHREGYLALTIPTALGGRGISIHDFCLVQEQLACGSGATALGANMHLYNLGGGLRLFREPFRQRVVDSVVREGAVIASSISEPSASLGSPLVTARKVAGGYRVSGRKYFCTLAPILRYFLFNARLEGFSQPGLSGTVTLAAERGIAGMEIIETWDAMGMRATGSHDIQFTDAFIADECLIGDEGAGVEGGLQSLPWYALGIASVYIGIAGAAFDFVVDYVKQRTLHPLPATIASLPGIQFTVAEMHIKLEAARAFIFKTAYELAHGADFGDQLLPKVTAPQYFATTTALDVVTMAMQAMGGPSIFRRYPIERLYRDVRAGTLHPYTHSWLLEMIGKLALGIPLDVQPRWV
ncbi:MAG: acyl-CoA/acyl-ACP dehydrogenase [Deltaproteobacteria bacterium]|nr:acyl-CoA/acyl-ACP dehydrogenase [Deltaproteobacteria bacterium]MBI3388788.1 acyl-CoA/acyl-ACP dehydrogenase [Deltaproteobacteria bacterium]